MSLPNIKPPSEEKDASSATTRQGPMELLPCPFCGSPAVVHQWPGLKLPGRPPAPPLYSVECQSLPSYHCPMGKRWLVESKSAAITSWNTRLAPSVELGGQPENAPGASSTTLPLPDGGSSDVRGEEKEKAFPDVMTTAQRKLYDVAVKKMEKELKEICDELDDCQRLTAEDFNIVINAK